MIESVVCFAEYLLQIMIKDSHSTEVEENTLIRFTNLRKRIVLQREYASLAHKSAKR